MKKISFILCLMLLISGYSVADEIENNGYQFSMQKDEFRNKGMEVVENLFTPKDMFELADVNADKKISLNELEFIIDGTSLDEASAKDDIRKYLTDEFYKADSNGDKNLDEKESEAFFISYFRYSMENEFKKIDRNNDGIYTEKDIPPVEESLEKLRKATKELEKNKEKLDSIPEEIMSQNIINNIMDTQNNENFFQADIDKDGCLSKEEYANFEFNDFNSYDDGEQAETDMGAIDIDFFHKMYDEIEKENKSCLNKDEYIKSKRISL